MYKNWRIWKQYRLFVKDFRREQQWLRNGRPAPPPESYKRKIVREYGKRFAAHTLIETGTFLGHMVQANKRRFKKIITIELDSYYYNAARERFANDDHITILPGDSGESPALGIALARLVPPVVFWLDAHELPVDLGARGTRATPILSELHQVLALETDDYVLLIDDMRIFESDPEYPSIAHIKRLILERHPAWQIEIVDDILRAHR